MTVLILVDRVERKIVKEEMIIKREKVEVERAIDGEIKENHDFVYILFACINSLSFVFLRNAHPGYSTFFSMHTSMYMNHQDVAFLLL